MSSAAIRGELETLQEAECLELLAAHELGRVAISVDGQPQILPVNYALHERRVAFRTAPGTKLEHGPRTHAAFEIDEFDRSTGIGWSVMVQGMLYDVTETIDRGSEALRRLAVEPLAPGVREHWLAIYPATISGRRFAIAPTAS
jgi:uncharacterized protein